MIQIGARLDKGAAGLRHLGAVDGDKAVHVQGGGLAETGAFQHRRPEQAVEVDDVLADKVIQLGVAVRRPVAVEVETMLIAVVLEAGHVADRRIQPDIEVLAGVAGNLEAEVGCLAGDVPRLQAGFQPFVQFVGDAVLQRAGTQPVAQHVAELGQVEEQLGDALHHRLGAADGGIGVDQFGGRVSGAADFAVIAVLVRSAALRAGALDEAVGQEHALFRVIQLGDLFFEDIAGGLIALEDQLGVVAVLFAMGAVIVIKADQEVGKIGLVLPFYIGNLSLRRDAVLLSL